MKKILITLGLALLIAIPSAVFALSATEIEQQIAEYEKKISSLREELVRVRLNAGTNTTLPTPAPQNFREFCNADRFFSVNVTGADVTALQEYLKSLGLLPSTNGTYDEATQAAIREFQKLQGIVSTGTPGTTGWGIVGPKTRAALRAKLCSVSVTPPIKLCIKEGIVCGVREDGSYITVRNECLLDAAKAKLAYAGECKNISVTPTPPTTIYPPPPKPSVECPPVAQPLCAPGNTIISNGTDANGCSLGSRCGPITTIDAPVCTLEYAPVCGAKNGIKKTYGNSCQMRGDSADFIQNGVCPAVSIAPPGNSGGNTGSLPDNCKTWTDGCNTCSRLAFGNGGAACTLKACASITGEEPPKVYQCLTYF